MHACLHACAEVFLKRRYCSKVEMNLATDGFCVTQNAGNGVTWRLLSLQPLKVVDPDHPLAALVRKAQADSPAPTPPTADGAAVQPSQVEYTTDCEYFVVRFPAGCQTNLKAGGQVW